MFIRGVFSKFAIIILFGRSLKFKSWFSSVGANLLLAQNLVPLFPFHVSKNYRLAQTDTQFRTLHTYLVNMINKLKYNTNLKKTTARYANCIPTKTEKYKIYLYYSCCQQKKSNDSTNKCIGNCKKTILVGITALI